MDQVVHRVLRFETFDLDLAQFCIRMSGRSTDLRPKTFEVLRSLAERPGELVSKDVLYREVWPDLVVSDDSLSQCIHELRQLLGDKEHRLIRTVSRRGYVLDAVPAAALVGSQSAEPLTVQRGERTILTRVALGVAAGLFILLLVGIRQPVLDLVAGRASPAASLIIPDADQQRIAALAAKKGLPLPVFQIGAPANDVPESARRFLGVWVSDYGWLGSRRQLMLIVTSVTKDGTARGYFVNGPAQPLSHLPGPAFFAPFTGHISDGVLRYDGSTGTHVLSFMPDGQIDFTLAHEKNDNDIGVVILAPVWTLGEDQMRKSGG